MIEIKHKTTGEVLKTIDAENLREADLRGADLRGADLREADLRGADLRGADLREADLRGADLREADLRGADLREADLQEADLREADLQGADLRGADLDLSSGIPFCCGGTKIKGDRRLFAQMVFHLTRQDWQELTEQEAQWLKAIPSEILNSFCNYRTDVDKM
jgi:hypothetical protein